MRSSLSETSVNVEMGPHVLCVTASRLAPSGAAIWPFPQVLSVMWQSD